MTEILEILTLNGYSRTGKSTVANELVKKGWVEASTSNYLNFETIEYFQLPDYHLWHFINKDNDDYYYERFGLNSREMKIFVAEEFLVPAYGRYGGLVLPTVKQALNVLEEFKTFKLLISTINVEEYWLFKRAIDEEANPNFVLKWHEPIYLIRNGALESVDLRKPFGRGIDNNGDLTHTLAEINNAIKPLNLSFLAL